MYPPGMMPPMSLAPIWFWRRQQSRRGMSSCERPGTAGIPICDRREFMAALLEGYRTIAVAGTHGKTTTTSMIAHILQRAGLDPSAIVGGMMGNTGLNALVGQSDIFVIEADEYGHMFLGLRPEIAVVTNIEHEHPDYFRTPEAHFQAFSSFVDLLPPRGMLISCADDEGASAS